MAIRAPSKLTWLFIALIAVGLFILSIDNPKPFDLTYDSIRQRAISIGTTEDISGLTRIHDISIFFEVYDEGRAKGYINIRIENLEQDDLSLTLFVMLPPDTTIEAPTIDGTVITADSRFFSNNLRMPLNIGGKNIQDITLEFDWPGFAHQTRYKQWEFYVLVRSIHFLPEIDFRPLDVPPEASTSRVSVLSKGYRFIEHHPDSAIDYPVEITWNNTAFGLDFTINGTYVDEQSREILEPLKQLAFYLPISGFVGLPIEYFRARANSPRRCSDPRIQ